MKYLVSLETFEVTRKALKSKIFDLKFVFHFRWKANSAGDKFEKAKHSGRFNENNESAFSLAVLLSCWLKIFTSKGNNILQPTLSSHKKFRNA